VQTSLRQKQNQGRRTFWEHVNYIWICFRLFISQFDDIIQETDELDDENRFMIDNDFHFNKLKTYDYNEENKAITVEDVMYSRIYSTLMDNFEKDKFDVY
jgi:hypothetical protein